MKFKHLLTVLTVWVIVVFATVYWPDISYSVDKITGWSITDIQNVFDTLFPTGDPDTEDWWTLVNDLKTNKLDATTAPDADNDVDEGYEPGSVWVDLTNDATYICVDNTDGAAVWNSLDDSGSTISTGTDPDITGTSEISNDTDGANLTGDDIYRGVDSSGNQFPVGQKTVTLAIPFSTSGSVTGWQVPTNETGMTFTFVRWFVRSDVDDLVVSMAEYTGIDDDTVLNEMGSVTASTDATGGSYYYGSQLAAAMTDDELETTHGWDIDISAAADGWILIQGWFDANVD